jgi:hypothetical protein
MFDFGLKKEFEMKPIINSITEDWIEANQHCPVAVEMWHKIQKEPERNPLEILKWLISIKEYFWANWFITRIMTYYDYVSYAVFAAEQVLDNYEKAYPDDKRPRDAIRAAKKCMKNPIEKNRSAAQSAGLAARSAARSVESVAQSAGLAAWLAAWSAGLAAQSAAQSAELAAQSAESATRLATWSAWLATQSAIHLKIFEYGMELLEKRN